VGGLISGPVKPPDMLKYMPFRSSTHNRLASAAKNVSVAQSDALRLSPDTAPGGASWVSAGAYI